MVAAQRFVAAERNFFVEAKSFLVAVALEGNFVVVAQRFPVALVENFDVVVQSFPVASVGNFDVVAQSFPVALVGKFAAAA